MKNILGKRKPFQLERIGTKIEAHYFCAKQLLLLTTTKFDDFCMEAIKPHLREYHAYCVRFSRRKVLRYST